MSHDGSDLGEDGELESCTLTIRVVKSFRCRNVVNFVLQGLNLKRVTPSELKQLVDAKIKGNKRLHGFQPDTLKIYTHAHLTKTGNLVINLGQDDWVLSTEQPLAYYGIRNESELSYYKAEDYDEWARNPVDEWDN